ncbi:MAG: DUF58 domain-containing protein [Oscillospiraceae bacterium]|nr:DUF58 domain-containing protein [Oscillospiraceae bacterium]
MKIIISYFLIFILIVLFALFLDAVSGFFVLIIFITAIVLSTILHIIAVKAFNCDISVDNILVEKGEEVRLTVRVSRAVIFLPTIFTIKLLPSYHFDCPECTCSVTLGRNEKEKVFVMKSAFWGKGSIGIESIRCVDILGIFTLFSRFNNFNKITEKNLCQVKVFPFVPDLSERSELVRVLQEASAYDDNENNREISTAITGFPGYEHRDYVPGDSLKSINWKLSAKRDKLLVRKPEAYAGGDQLFVLDNKAAEISSSVIGGEFSDRKAEQRSIEALLSLIRVMTVQELICRVYVRITEGWDLFVIDGEDGLEALRFALTEYSFRGSGERIPDITSEKVSGFVIFTAHADDVLLSVTEGLKQNGIIAETASSVIGIANDWLIEEAHNEIIFTRK